MNKSISTESCISGATGFDTFHLNSWAEEGKKSRKGNTMNKRKANAAQLNGLNLFQK
uniref:Bm14298 n=1 Tax=Brugia malayi TaxID=6279 RepID=A0A1I9G509_BRUMA|nr:Bm14298 [Brugia malayi]